MTSVSVVHLYVHAPFCERRCFYCDFAVQVGGRSGGRANWQAALKRELAIVAREGIFDLGDELSTLYVGGGTPSALGSEAMISLARVVGPERLGAQDLEWTAEANPESFDADLAREWHSAGVNRLSLGQQSFHQPALEWMGRLHGPSGGSDALEQARRAGFANVNLDLIFGLPARLERDWALDVERVLALAPEHVSLYGLTVEEGTPLHRAVNQGREVVCGEDRYRDEYLYAAETLEREGYVHYELSNFAREGFESRHNSACWNGAPYLGIGNGAHSHAPPLRRWNERDWELYTRRVAKGESPEVGREWLTAKEQLMEDVWLALRTRKGIPNETEVAASVLVDRWRIRGWALFDGRRVRLTPEGWLRLDTLAIEMANHLERGLPDRSARWSSPPSSALRGT